MAARENKGKFVVVEGLDGSGKSTQASCIFEYLARSEAKLKFGHRGAHLTREPTAGMIGGLIRSQLAHEWKSSRECLQLLFAADRAYHLEKEILPLLAKGVTVVSDRYFISSCAYGSAVPKDIGWFLEVNKKFLVPDLTFYIDVSPKVCLKRIHGDRLQTTIFEKEKELERVRKNYLIVMKKFRNIVVVNGERPVDVITSDIISSLAKYL